MSTHTAFLAEKLLDPIPNAAEEEFRHIAPADFSPRRHGASPPRGPLERTVDKGPCSVAVTLHARVHYREWWEKRLREHEAEVWRIRHGVD